LSWWRSTARPASTGSAITTSTAARTYLVAYAIDDDQPARELRLGFDNRGRLLEIVVLLLDDGVELVIHAMKARPQYFDLLP